MIITVFGGDERSIAAARYLSQAGHAVSVFALKTLLFAQTNTPYDADVILFPLPLCGKDGLINCPLCDKKYSISEVFPKIKSGTKTFAGAASKFAIRAAEEFGVDLTDYYSFEELKVKNAVPTAEGALFEYMKRKKTTLFGSKFVVTGYGRVGRRLAVTLTSLGGRVTVAARSEKDIASAICDGSDAVNIDELKEYVHDAECVFNTVPYNVFDERTVSSFGDGTLYVELASSPYGMSDKDAGSLGERHVLANSLPGKYAPLSAGKIIAETVCKYI